MEVTDTQRNIGEPVVAKSLWWTPSLLIFTLLLLMISSGPVIPPIPADFGATSQNISPSPPYGANSPIGQYNGSGNPSNVLATYNKTENTKTETSDTADFTIPTVIAWDAVFDISFSNLTTDSIVLDIETNDSTNDGPLGLTRAMSFQITNSCRLTSLMLMLQANVGGFGSNPDVMVFVFNATNSGGSPEPNTTLAGYSASLDLVDTKPTWFNLTFPTGSILDPAATYNNYFFVAASNVLSGDANWNYRNDAGTGDGGLAYRHTGAVWLEVLGIDHFLNVSLAPLTNSPAPSGVSMQVNSTTVSDDGANSGTWNGFVSSTGSSTFFDVTASWPLVFNFTYDVEFSFSFPSSTYFNVTTITNAQWNISAAISFPNIGANPNSRTLNFSIPEWWTVTGAYKDSNPVTITDKDDGGSVPGYAFIDEPDGAGNSTQWELTSTDNNYGQNLFIFRGGLDLTGQEVNITDSLEVRSSLLPIYNDGSGRLVIYNALGTDLDEWSLAPSGNFWLNFSAFTPQDYAVTNDHLTCEVVWSNGWHVGVITNFVWIVYSTDATPDSSTYDGYAGDLITLRVYYRDTYNTQPIPGADQAIVIVNGSSYPMNDEVNGWYNYTWDTTGKDRGTYPVRFELNETGYSEAIGTASVSLGSHTQLSLAWTSEFVNYTQSKELRVDYTRTTGGNGGIAGAVVNVTIVSITYPMQDHGNGTYSILLNGTDLGLGLHAFTVRAQTVLHEGKQDSGDLTVIEDLTQITGDTNLSVWGGNAFNVTLVYQTQTGSPLSGASITCLRNGTPYLDFNWVFVAGEYKVNFTFTAATNTTYVLDFTIGQYGFASQVWNTQIQVSVIPSILEITSQSDADIVHGDPIQLEFTFSDGFGSPLSGADIILNWTMTTPEITKGIGIYSIEIPTEGAQPGTWHIQIQFQLINYEEREVILTYHIKFYVQVSTGFEGNIVEGGFLSFCARITYQNGTVVEGVEGGLVEFAITVGFIGGATENWTLQAITNSSGWGKVNFTLPSVDPMTWFTHYGFPLVLRLDISFIENDCFLGETAEPIISQVAKSVLNFFIVEILPWLTVVLIILFIIFFAWRRRAKKRAVQEQETEIKGSSWAHRLMGIMDLRALFVMYSKTGLPIFTYDFAGGEMPSALLSGFISAVNAFYGELSGEIDRESQLRDVHYKDLHLSLREGQRTVSVLILDASPTEELTDSLANFNVQFESHFATELENFDGRIDLFDKASAIVENSFHSELLIAYECSKPPSRGFSRKIYDLAMKMANTDGRVFLPQLFLDAIKKFGENKKFAIASALEQLLENGCLIPFQESSIISTPTSEEVADSSSLYF